MRGGGHSGERGQPSLPRPRTAAPVTAVYTPHDQRQAAGWQPPIHGFRPRTALAGASGGQPRAGYRPTMEPAPISYASLNPAEDFDPNYVVYDTPAYHVGVTRAPSAPQLGMMSTRSSSGGTGMGVDVSFLRPGGHYVLAIPIRTGTGVGVLPLWETNVHS